MKRTWFLFLLLPLVLYAEDFDTLMGKNSPHWKYVKTTDDIQLLSQFKALYQKNITQLSTTSTEQKIPKLIHFIWIGPKPFPPHSVENVRSWIAHHPDWTVIFWTDRDRLPPCNGMERRLIQDFTFTTLKAQYEDSDNYGEKSDLLRYEILYQLGGVYADHDANCLQPFAPLHSAYDFYCCFETPHPVFSGRNVTCGIGLLGSRPNHPALKFIFSWLTSKWDAIGEQYKGKDAFSKKERVLNRTYIALTNAIQQTLDQPGNVDIVLPAAYFFAKQGIPSLYSKHFYTTVWADDKVKASTFEKASDKLLAKAEKRLERATYFAFALLFCTPFSFLLLRKKR